MGYAAALVLDEASAETISKLFEASGSRMLTLEAPPHVSLAVFEQVDTSRLIDVIGTLAGRVQSLRICFASIGIFPGGENVVFLAPVVTDALLKLHADLHDLLVKAGLESDPYYLPGAWVPHCTITIQEALLSTLETIQTIHAAEVMGEYWISEIQVIEFEPVKSLASFRLAWKATG